MKTSVRLSADETAWLDSESAKRHMTRSMLFRECIRLGMELSKDLAQAQTELEAKEALGTLTDQERSLLAKIKA